ncbi:MAG: hypothetical protein ACREQ5_33315 [Candidatus Dormibacteria bacterium]
MTTDTQKLEALCVRIAVLESKMDRVIKLFEQANGAFLFAKWAAAIGASVAAIGLFFVDHIKFK